MSKKTAVLEKFFSAAALPTEILSKMLSGKNSSKAGNAAKSKSEKGEKFINKKHALLSLLL